MAKEFGNAAVALEFELLHILMRRCCLKKNLNAPRPSEHPPVRGKKMSKRLGGINS